MRHHFKTFMLGKDGEADGRQDALAANPGAGLYIVADGVSNSYHPEILSALLCRNFCLATPDQLMAWEEYAGDVLMPGCSAAWNAEIEEYLGTLDIMERDHEEMQRERHGYGASTFCAVWIDSDAGMLRYYVCGDSTLFVRMKDGRVAAYNTAHKYVGENGLELTDYTNRTYALSTDRGYEAGIWNTGSLPLDGAASAALMTDGMAEWFQRTLAGGDNPEAALWALEDDADFNRLVAAERAGGGMDDDLAAILIDFEDTAPGETCMAIVLYNPSYAIPFMPEPETAAAKSEETQQPPVSRIRDAIDRIRRWATGAGNKNDNQDAKLTDNGI